MLVIPQRAEHSNAPSAFPMTFHSILFERTEDRIEDEALEAPHFFVDLNCDQVVHAITAGKEEYNLKSLFHACLRRIDAIEYRHEVMQDLENASLLERVYSFARARHARTHRSGQKAVLQGTEASMVLGYNRDLLRHRQ